MKLVIAEKSIAGKRIAEILAEKEVHSSAEGKAPLFKFSVKGEEFAVLPLKGHIVEVDFPVQYAQWIGTDLRKLVNAEIEYKGTEKAIISLLKQSAPKAEEIIIATDADREGESIGVEAINYLKEKNSHLKIKRAYFSAITPKEIQDAFSKLGEVDYNFADSADARREIDLIWGAVLTRFLSIVSGRLGKQFLSVGRVQGPTLAIIVKREKERLAFKQETYWEIKAIFEKDGAKFEALHKKGRFKEKEEAEAVLQKKKEKCTVIKVEKKERILSKPVPFNTTEFLRAASAIGFSAGEAMNTAEYLYMQGFTSYPRTDNQVYPSSTNFREILNELLKVQELHELTKKILFKKTIVPSKGKLSKDHPPIHPVSFAPKHKLSEKQWRIYELIARRFLATLAEEAITENLIVEIDMNKEIFVARGQRILQSGWKEFYPYSILSEVILPEMEKGDIVLLKKLELLEKMTLPPPRYSQGALIKLMEQLGIGTKSTRHEIIQKLYARHYISGIKAIEPNTIAFAVIDSLEKYSKKVIEPKMSSELEKEMDEIAAAKKTRKEVVKDSRNYLEEILAELLKNKDEIGKELRKALARDAIAGKCTNPECGGELRILTSRNNKRFLGCTKYPKCTVTYPLPQKGHLILLNTLCKDCGKPTIKLIGKRYRYEMCIDPNCKSKAEWKKKSENSDSEKKK